MVGAWQACWDINFLGYVRVVQAFLPLLRAAAAKPGARRGRIVCIGTGGGRYSPSPPMISAYMASKWSVEAFVHTLRFELQLQKLPIDACMLNPGTIKPTALASVGQTLAEKMWKSCVPAAKQEYGALLDKLIQHQANEVRALLLVLCAMRSPLRREKASERRISRALARLSPSAAPCLVPLCVTYARLCCPSAR